MSTEKEKYAKDKKKSKTGLRKKIYLIEHSEDDIRGSKLPSNVQTLRFLVHNLRLKPGKGSQTKAYSVTAEKVMLMWKKARIPTRAKSCIVTQLKGLLSTWKSLQKTSNRRDSNQISQEDAFKDTFDDLFDVAPKNVMNLIRINEDKKFLEGQRRKGREGSMGTVDTKLHRKDKKSAERKEKLRKYQERSREELKSGDKTVSLLSKVEDRANPKDLEGPNFPLPKPQSANQNAQQPAKKKRGRKQVITPQLAADLDTAKVSVRSGTKIVFRTAESLKINTAEVNINKSTMHREINKHRRRSAEKIRDGFVQKVQKLSLIVHFDGKRMKMKGGVTSERLPVAVTGPGIEEQLLGSPALPNGTGTEQAKAVVNLLDQWGITDRVKACCTDTTNANTGLKKGAIVEVEKLLQRSLLYLACRHHVAEIILKSVFETAVAVSSGPDIAIFKRLEASWPQIDKDKFTTGVDDPSIASILRDKKDELLQFILHKLTEKHSRDDYKELLELTYIFLGGVPPSGIKFYKPGALHEARFMARGIYSLKLVMFKDQLKLTKNEKKALTQFSLFVVLVYVKYWFNVVDAVSAPRNDFELLSVLIEYQRVDQKISEVAVKKFTNHLWYLSDELSGLALLDDKVSFSVKNKIAEKILSKQSSRFTSVADVDSGVKRFTLKPKDVPDFLEKDLSCFVSPSTVNLFSRFGLGCDFLKFDSATWHLKKDYQDACKFFADLNVTNDVAERGVALTQDYLNRTSSEDNFQDLLLVSQATRRTKCTKNAMDLSAF